MNDSTHIQFTDLNGDINIIPKEKVCLHSEKDKNKLVVVERWEDSGVFEYEVSKHEFARLVGILT